MCFLRPTRVFGWLDPNTNSETADTRPEITHPNNRPDYAQPILSTLFTDAFRSTLANFIFF
jgi:hypothetical protein